MEFGRNDISLEAKLFTVKVKFSGQISMYFMNLKWQPFWIPIWPPSVTNIMQCLKPLWIITGKCFSCPEQISNELRFLTISEAKICRNKS